MYNKPNSTPQNQLSDHKDGVNYSVVSKGNAISNTGKEEAYYMTENSMYNKPSSTTHKLSDHPQGTNDYQTCSDDYDIIQTAIQNKDSVNSVVNKGSTVSSSKMDTGLKAQENEYNHLNEIPAIAPTGNVYSSTGYRNNESETGNLYNCARHNLQRNNSRRKITENVYNRST